MKWKEMERDIIRCTKCGSCQAVCPIFKELQSESAVARGKVSLMKAVLKGNIEPTAEFIEKMSLCLNCKACTVNCPSKTPVDHLVLQTREKLVAEHGLPLAKRLVLRMALKHRKLFDMGMNMGSIFQGLVLKEVKGKGVLPRLPMGLKEKRLLAPVASKSLRSRYPERVEVESPRETVAFFTGCTINYMFPEIGVSVVEVLKKNNINVIIPGNQHCCGTPAYANGDITTAIELARATVDALSLPGMDAVITACGSCGSAIRKEYQELLKNEPGYPEKVEALAKKTVDFTEYMVKIGIKASDLKPINRVVTYHESCHLTRGQGVKKEPRQVMTSIPGVTLKEMKEPGRCCGMAGSFSLSHYELARKINQHKIDDIISTGADTLITGCGSCIMHIRDGIYQNGLKIEVLHTAQLLAEAYK